MKQSINFSAFVDAFRAFDRYDSFGYQALEVIFKYLEEYEDSTGEEIELDVISICCDFNSENWEDISNNYSIDLSGIDKEDDDYEERCKQIVLDYLYNNTMVLGETDCEIVYQVF